MGPFIASIEPYVPGAMDKLVFDRFRIMKHVNKGLDKVGKSGNRELLKGNNPTLKATKYFLLYRGKNLPEKYRDRLGVLMGLHLRTGRAYAL